MYDLEVAADGHSFALKAGGAITSNSHATAYALIGYQTAYLKYHYPAEFLAACASCDADNEAKMQRAIAEVKGSGIPLLGPDVARSDSDFSVEVRDGVKHVRLGLGAIKGCGEAAIQALLEARGKKGFTSFWDVCARTDSKRCGKKVIELLIDVGAFDSLGIPNRATAIRSLDVAVASGVAARKDAAAGQMSLTAMFGASAKAKAITEPKYQPVAEMPAADRLRREKEALGFYLSGHPLDASRALIARLRVTSTVVLEDIDDRTEVRLAGIVTGYEARMTKGATPKQMARFTLEDADGSVEVVVFPGVFAKAAPVLTGDGPVYVLGTLQTEGDEDQRRQKVLLREAKRLADVPVIDDTSPRVAGTLLTVTVPADRVTRGLLETLKTILDQYPGDMPVVINFRQEGRWVQPATITQRCAPTQNMLAAIDRCAGKGSAQVK